MSFLRLKRTVSFVVSLSRQGISSLPETSSYLSYSIPASPDMCIQRASGALGYIGLGAQMSGSTQRSGLTPVPARRRSQ